MEKIVVRHGPDNNIVNLPVLRLYREPDQIINLIYLQMEKIDVRHCPDNNIVNLPVLRPYREPDQIINLIYLWRK